MVAARLGGEEGKRNSHDPSSNQGRGRPGTVFGGGREPADNALSRKSMN